MTYKKISGAGYQKIPFPLRVALGQFNRYKTAFNGGYLPTTSSVEQDIWAPGGRLVRLLSAEPMSIVSDSANDTIAGGTGAQILLLIGLDNDYNEISEIVVLTGTVAAITLSSFVRIVRGVVVQAGSTGSNVGNITITSNTSATIQSQLLPTDNITSHSHFTVPAGKVFAILGFQSGISGGTDATIRIRLALGENGLYVTASFLATRRASELAQPPVPTVIPEKSDLVITVESDGAVSQASGGFIGTLIDQREFNG